MGLTEALANRAGIEIRKVGSLRLVASADCQAFLDACLDAGEIIIGIEGFSVENAQVRPDVNAIADFSSLESCEESVTEARVFVEAVARPELLFDFSFSERASRVRHGQTAAGSGEY